MPERDMTSCNDASDEVGAELGHLNDSEQRLRVLADASFEAIFLSENGTCIDQNISAEALFGYSHEEALGQPGTNWIVPENRELVMKNMLDGVQEPYEVTALRKDGSTFPCEIQGRMLTYHGKQVRVTALRDITPRIEAQRARDEAEQKNDALIKSIPDLMLVVSKDGIFIDVKVAADTRVYSPQDAFLGHSIFEVMPRDVAELGMKTIATVLSTGQTTKMEYALFVEGGHRNYEARATACADDQILFIIRDITETLRLREVESRSQRLETAGHIAGQVAHDFNNLLGPLMAYPELIRDSLPDGDDAHQLLTSMEDAAKQISEINQQLLTLGRRGHYNQESLDLNRIVEQAIRNLPPQPDTVTIAMDLADNLLHVKGGASQIHRAVSNLLINAIDAIDGSGTIHVSTANHYVDHATMAYDRISRGEYAMLTIKDSGGGIEDDILDKIFDPFFTTKTVTKQRGSGLGLSIVDGVVRDHGGSLDLESHPGEGTTFRLYFPITRDKVEPRQTISVTGRGETILVVDDDVVQREVTVRILDKLGYNATAVESGEKALRFLESLPRDLLVLDMVMPGGIDGTETYRRVVERTPGQRAIIVSGYSDSIRVKEAQELGAGAFVKKPLTLDALGRAVREELDRTRRVTPESPAEASIHPEK